MELVEHNLPLVQKKMDELEPKDWLKFFSDILAYTTPKLKAIEVNENEIREITPVKIELDDN